MASSLSWWRLVLALVLETAAAGGSSQGQCLSTPPGYSCVANASCSSEGHATRLGPMSLEACLAACQGYQDCQVILYHCNADCLLLRDCGAPVDTNCGSSVYFRSLDHAPGSALILPGSALSGACYASSSREDLDDFGCTEATYCIQQDWTARQYEGMSLMRCAALCRATNCQAFQYGCGDTCILFPFVSGCALKVPSTCGSSAYERIQNRSRTTFSLGLGKRVVYSPQACVDDGCWVDAQCPQGSSPVSCQTVPPNTGHGAYSTERGCAAQGSGRSIVAEAICMEAFSTRSFRSAWGFDNMTLPCPPGFMTIACNCLQNSWAVGEPCAGLAELAPTPSASGSPVCRHFIDAGLGDQLRMSWHIGARLSAICLSTSGLLGAYSLTNSRDSEPAAAEMKISYCGWAKTHVRNDVDCIAWMRAPLPDGGCNVSECLGLADCAEVCSACSLCRGVYFFLGEGSAAPAARCYFQGDTLNSINPAMEQYPSVATPSSPWAVYVNNRDARCGRERSIFGVSFFKDSLCTELVVPTTLAASAFNDGTDYTLKAAWWQRPASFSPRSCAICPAQSIQLRAVFDPPVPVLCAIVDSSEDFAAGWTLNWESSGSVAESVSGNWVAFNKAVDSVSSKAMVRGATVTLRGTMELECQASALPCSAQSLPSLPHLLRRVMASILGLRQHMIDFHETFGRDEEAGSVMAFAFLVVVKVVISTPGDVGLYLKASALLRDMQQQVASLTTALNQLHSLPLAVRQLSSFAQHISTPPGLSDLPPLPPPPVSTTEAGDTTLRATEDTTGALAAPGPYFIALVGLSVPVFCFVSVIAILVLVRLRRHGFQDTSNGRNGSMRRVLGKALQRSEEERVSRPLAEEVAAHIPEYWAAADGLLYARHEHLQDFQTFLDFTYRGIATQDRLCPTREHAKMRGGCPCVRPGGDPGLPKGYAVRQVVRVENSEMFAKYLQRRDEIMQSRGRCERPNPAIFTSDALRNFDLKAVLCSLEEDVNEVYLWHGTSVRRGLSIAQTNFNLSLAGSGGGTMYGKGLYFSESATKADEYSKDDPGNHYEGLRALLLCRVCLGKFHYTLEREPAAILKYGRGQSDSTLGDRAQAVNTYREMCVYDTDQVYPEYLLLYQRLHGEETAPEVSREAPFLLELPLYWKNVCRNPATEAFREHWTVKSRICGLLQLLADETAGGSTHEVLSARRVEDSGLWLKYMGFKRTVHENLRESGELQCPPPKELRGGLGHGSLWAELDAERLEARDLSVAVNELLLWHGTSREAAESIAERGFEFSERSTHGRRYGPGVYLAEDLSKSISYCPDKAGSKYVLLCRAVCGQIYYTEKGWHDEAGKDAARQGKHCVLANPNREGPWEYILLDSAQVYPEYIVEFAAESTQPEARTKQTRVYALSL